MSNGNERGDEQAPVAPAGGDFTAPIQVFFQQVADGVIAAQEHLDKESMAYLKGRARAQERNGIAIAPPAAFRIPKVSAEFTLAAERKDEKGINFIVSVSRERREMMQQKVSFEIVSVPLPVDETIDEIQVEPQQPSGAEDVRDAGLLSADRGDRLDDAPDFSMAHAKIALARVTDEREHTIAGRLLANQDHWVRAHHRDNWVLLFSEKLDSGERALHMAVIDRKDETAPAKVFSSHKDLADSAQRFRAIVEQIAELVGNQPEDESTETDGGST